jgi:protein required for attachment to host cells
MTKHLRFQFIVADGARARWVRRSENADDFVTTKETKAEPHAPGHPQGVVFEGSSGRRFSVEERQGAVREHREAFAREVADTISAEVVEGAFERLIIVAPARTLAAIRRRLSGAAKALLGKTLAKDLSKTPDHELGTWLRPLELA